MAKKVLVSRNFLDGVKLLVDTLNGEYTVDKGDIALEQAVINKLCRILSAEMEQKREALDRREAFTAYKTAEQGTADREALRQSYLDHAELHKDWRSSREHTH
jgi:hypothetical protein